MLKMKHFFHWSGSNVTGNSTYAQLGNGMIKPDPQEYPFAPSLLQYKKARSSLLLLRHVPNAIHSNMRNGPVLFMLWLLRIPFIRANLTRLYEPLAMILPASVRASFLGWGCNQRNQEARYKRSERYGIEWGVLRYLPFSERTQRVADALSSAGQWIPYSFAGQRYAGGSCPDQIWSLSAGSWLWRGFS